MSDSLPAPLCDGWDAFDYSNLAEVLHGSDRMPGYYSYTRARSLTDYGVDVPSKSYDLTLSPCEFLSKLNENRINLYSDYRIVIYHPSHGYRYMPVTVRGMYSYQRKIEENFTLLADYILDNNLPVVHLRLSPRARYGKSPLDSLMEMKSVLNKLMSFLAKHLGHRPYYVWAIEPTKRGHCHYHILFIGLRYIIDKPLLDAWFAAQGLGDHHGVYIEALRSQDGSVEKLVNYLIEYVAKPQSDSKWQGLLTLTRKREWGMSTRLRRLVTAWAARRAASFACIVGETNSNSPKWEFVAIMTTLEIEMLIANRDRPPDDVISDLLQIRGATDSINEGRRNRPNRM